MNGYFGRILFFAAWVAFLAGASHTRCLADEYDDLRLKWKNVITGGDSYDVTDPDIAAKIAAIADTAQGYWDTMDTSAGRTYLWSEYPTDNGVYWSYVRVQAMVVAYCTHGSTLKGDAALLQVTIEALDWLHDNWYNAGQPPIIGFKNFHRQIAVPMRLGDIGCMLYDELGTSRINDWCAAVDHYCPVVNLTGANRAYQARPICVRGVLGKNSAKIAHARNGLSQLFDYCAALTGDGDGDGFYIDGSFIQHSRHPYTGGYAAGLLRDVVYLLYLLDGSSWEVTDPDKVNVFNWVQDSFEPVIWRGGAMDMVRGRTISFYDKTSYGMGPALAQIIARLAQAASPADALCFKRMIKQWIQSQSYCNFYDKADMYTLLLFKDLVEDAAVSPRGDLVKYKQFPIMDRAVHFRPGFAFGISMHSNRIWNYECLEAGMQNPKGWHTGDGQTYLYNSDVSQFSDTFWCTVNMRRLPGTTVSRNQSPHERILSNQNWVGGVQWQGTYGVCGMALEPDPSNQSLHAKKSWFCFDNEVVALGAGIRSSDNQVVETILENRKLAPTGDNALTVDGSSKSTALGWSEDLAGVNWIHLADNVPDADADIGYYFPTPAAIRALREQRTGSWHDVNYSRYTDELHTNNFMTMWFEHGNNPVGAAYSYVLLPNRSSAQVSDYAANPDITVLENSSSVQAVREETLNIIGANFWTNTSRTVDMITCRDRASVMLQENVGANIVVAVADPTQVGSTVRIELARETYAVLSKASNITVSQQSPTTIFTVNVSGKKGGTSEITFSIDPDDGPPPERMLDLVGWWKMDGNLQDASPSGLHGTWQGSGSAGYVGGVYGQGVTLPGQDQYVAMPDHPAWDTGDELTISHWVRSDRNVSTNKGAGICHDLTGTTRTFKYLIYLNGGSGLVGFFVRFADGTEKAASFTPTTNWVQPTNPQWHHIAAVFDRDASDGKRIKLYFDAVLMASDDGLDQDLQDGTGLGLGLYRGSSDYHFDGDFDDVAIFDTALTFEQIQQLHDGNRTPGNVVESERPVIDSGPTAAPNPAQSGEDVSFAVTASDPDGDALSYAWDFGDAASGSGATPTHTYATTGSFTATVTVSDGTLTADATVVVEVTDHHPGDLNGDRLVNIVDLVLVTSHFGQTSGDPNWDARADANKDGFVNITDLVEVTANFGKLY